MLSRTPFVSIVLSFMTGILFGEYFLPVSGWLLMMLSVVAFGLVAVWVWYIVQKRSPSGTAPMLFFLLSGSLVISLQNGKLEQAEKSLDGHPCIAYTAVITSLPEKRTKNLRFEAHIDQFKTDQDWKQTDLKALISIPLDAEQVPGPGSRMLVYGSPEQPSSPLNPDEFNYKRYLRNKGIVWSDYLTSDSYGIVDASESLSGLRRWSFLVSSWADEVFRKQIQDDDSYGLVKAMLLGRRDDLRSEQVDNYTISGTVHILSVSGMHVAIIFLALSKLLGWIRKLKGGNLIYLILITSSLGFYALVTGLPPSVQRATLMCIIVVMAETFGRKQASINTLAISALLILVFDPHALFDIGFQLSFLAMSGIFLFYRPMADLWRPSNRIYIFLWEITALSFAAQLATFPLSLYYFHQFPSYFWLVNPLVIFFTNILLPASMVLLLVSTIPIPWIQYLADQTVHFSAYFTNISVAVPRHLPNYVLKSLQLDAFEAIVLYLFMFVIWYAYESRKWIALKYSFALGFLFVFYSVSQSIQLFYSDKAYVHAVPRHSVLSFKSGNHLYLVSDSAFIKDDDAYNFRLANYAVKQGVLHIIHLSGMERYTTRHISYIKHKHGEVAIWHGRSFHRGAGTSGAEINYQVLTSGYPSEFLSSASLVMLGGEIRGRSADRWKQYIAANKIAFHDLSDGAFHVPE
jgi:competence protein ComEC